MESLWSVVQQCNFAEFEKKCKLMFLKYGTTLHTNRFTVGVCIERFLGDVLREKNLVVDNTSNARRTDLAIKNFGKFSVKYSSGRDIKLYNCLGRNQDKTMCSTILVRPKYIMLLTPKLIGEYDLDYKDYIKDVNDGTMLRDRLITLLLKRGYKYKKDINISVDKDKCKNEDVSDLLYERINKLRLEQMS